MTVDDPKAYVQQVMAEIEEEVRLRRASGDLPPKLERELDELFLAHSPVAGRGGDLGEALRMVDAVTFIDPVVPVESNRAAGAFVKKGMRTAMLWYVGWVTHQMSQSASAVSRALHIVDGRLKDLERRLEAQQVPGAGVVEFPALHDEGAWWVEAAVGAVAKAPGRVLHAACGDGWLVRRIVAAGGDAYGVDPRRAVVEGAALGTLDLRDENVTDHLRAVAAAGLGADGAERSGRGHDRRGACSAPRPRSAPASPRVARSSSTASAVRPSRLPTHQREADLASGRPLRPETWRHLLEGAGYRAEVRRGPDDVDYLVTAERAVLNPFPHDRTVSAAAGAPVAVHQFVPTLNPHDATGTHTLLHARHPARGRVALGDLRRGHPRRPRFRGVQALDVP